MNTIDSLMGVIDADSRPVLAKILYCMDDPSLQALQAVLEDGETLAVLGVTDADIEAVEDIHDAIFRLI